jgi:hypothetical protein
MRPFLSARDWYNDSHTLRQRTAQRQSMMQSSLWRRMVQPLTDIMAHREVNRARERMREMHTVERERMNQRTAQLLTAAGRRCVATRLVRFEFCLPHRLVSD